MKIGNFVQLSNKDDILKITIRKYVFYPLNDYAETVSNDKRYRYVYIQIDEYDKKYYIGVCCRKNLNEAINYNGSGHRFKPYYRKHRQNFKKYILTHLETDDEIYELERNLVTNEMLEIDSDFCLNLDVGGSRQPRFGSWKKLDPIKYKNILKYCVSCMHKKRKEHPELWYRSLEMRDKNTDKVLKTFISLYEASKYIFENVSVNGSIKTVYNKISHHIHGQGKSAYGYRWNIVDNEK